jgi:hypothetical protein
MNPEVEEAELTEPLYPTPRNINATKTFYYTVSYPKMRRRNTNTLLTSTTAAEQGMTESGEDWRP